jgi:hypothetical protein
VLRLTSPAIKFSLLGLGLVSALIVSAHFDESPVLIQSLESKTIEGHPVFNRIQLQSTSSQDTWVMQQSHSGLETSSESWDRLAIIVDKTQSPKTAKFMQLEPGSMSIENAREIPYKVSCYLCHANGPRALRPDFNSSIAKITLWDRSRIWMWNLKIKTYGRIDTPDLKVAREGKPFRYPQAWLNEKLQVKTCERCHKEEGLFARGTLTRQNFMAIRFLVESGQMPPAGFTLSDGEREEIVDFLKRL